MSLLIILAIPLILLLFGLVTRSYKLTAIITPIGYFLAFILAIMLGKQLIAGRLPLTYLTVFYADALSLFFVFTILVVSLAVALYSAGYIEREVAHRLMTIRKANTYYLLLNAFVFSMLLVTLVNNLGLMWVAIEITTLVSAFLVGFNNDKKAVEAAWKYIIICSVGIVLALLGTILFSYAFLFSTGLKSLNWTEMMSVAWQLDHKIVLIAFIFILVGYGTKAGLAPMHTWLPDAHSQAVSPISALLSGVLLKTSIYAILRYSLLVKLTLGYASTGHLFIIFGLISLIVSAGLILVQKDIKRLFAYSSIEHIGLIIFGFGVGGPIGTYGALWHIFNHAVTKSFLFFGAGNLVTAFKGHNVRQMRGAIRLLPFTGVMVMIGIFALTGFPPFSIFFSELLILFAAFKQGYTLAGVAALILLVVIFSALVYHFGKILLGEKPKEAKALTEPWPIKLAMIFQLVFIIGSLWIVPGYLTGLIDLIVKMMRGV